MFCFEPHLILILFSFISTSRLWFWSFFHVLEHIRSVMNLNFTIGILIFFLLIDHQTILIRISVEGHVPLCMLRPSLVRVHSSIEHNDFLVDLTINPYWMFYTGRSNYLVARPWKQPVASSSTLTIAISTAEFTSNTVKFHCCNTAVSAGMFHCRI